MAQQAVDLDAYLQRIGYTGQRQATLAALKALHTAHALTIPFENLTSLGGERVPLELPHLQRKLVEERRGGYCFEHNSLFLAVLRELGFTAHGLAARVCWKVPPEAAPAPRTHMLLQVTVEGEPWLADVGFGGLTQTVPLRFAPGVEQATTHEPFRIRQLDHRHYRLEAKLSGYWQPLYEFDSQPQATVDYEPANWFVSTHPNSKFVQHLIAARPAVNGRHALMDNRYTFHRLDGSRRQRQLTSVDELIALLGESFGADVPASQALRRKLEQLVRRPAS